MTNAMKVGNRAKKQADEFRIHSINVRLLSRDMQKPG